MSNQAFSSAQYCGHDLTVDEHTNWYRWQPPLLQLRIRVQPRARVACIDGVINGAVRVRVKAPPVDSKANQDVVRFLASAFGVPRSRIKIIRGNSSRLKTLQIDRPECLPTELQSHLKSIVGLT